MKLLRHHPKALWVGLILVIITNALLWWWGTSSWLESFKVFWVWVIPAVLIFLFPPHKKTIANLAVGSSSPARVIASIFGLQLFLAFLLETSVQFLQLSSSAFGNENSLPVSETAHLFVHLPLSILPWLGVGLLVCGFRYCRDKQTNLTLGRVLYPAHPKNSQHLFILFVNVISKASSQSVLALSLMSLVLLTLLLISPSYFHRLRGMGWYNLFFWIAFLILIFGPFIKKFMDQSLKGVRWNLIVVFISSLLIVVGATFFCLALFSLSPTPSLSFFSSFIPFTPLSYTQIKLFSLLWQLGWIPMLAVFLTQTTQGFSSRALLITLLGSGYLIQFLMTWLHPLLHHSLLITWLAGVLSWIGLAALFNQPSSLTWLMQVSLPGSTDKFRPCKGYVLTFLKLTGYFIFIMSIIGLTGLNFILLPLFGLIGLFSLWLAILMSWKLLTQRTFF